MQWNYVRFLPAVRINTSINTTLENKVTMTDPRFITHFYHSYSNINIPMALLAFKDLIILRMSLLSH